MNLKEVLAKERDCLPIDCFLGGLYNSLDMTKKRDKICKRVYEKHDIAKESCLRTTIPAFLGFMSPMITAGALGIYYCSLLQ